MGPFEEVGRFGINPVSWHELARHGVTVRGPALTASEVYVDDAALRAFSDAALSGYWSHLLATGSLTSKSGAGRYALLALGARRE
ncbi:hypothetical protein [Streptomyces sp. NPDC102490]|jgi:hypothetical protein|uniref:hypothetical protein n=1 Tax=Streptomyces sp. NPDC102490 TaxID=3366183 RepID=UPI003824A3CC